MSTIDLGVTRQLLQLAQRAPHLLRRAFKQTPTPHCKQCVTWEHGLCVRRPERGVALGVTGSVEHLELHTAQVERLTFGKGNVNKRNALFVSFGAHNLALISVLELMIAACVISMVVRV